MVFLKVKIDEPAIPAIEPVIEPLPVDVPVAAVPHPPIPPPPVDLAVPALPVPPPPPADVVLHRLHRQQEQYDQKWDAKYRELVEYHGRHGTANVPQSEGVLGRWVGRQREAKKKGLPEDRVQLLERLGIDWAPKADVPSWDERLAELTEYLRCHGTTNVSTSNRGGKLGSWVRIQRRLYKSGKLSQDKAEKLNAIGFDFAPKNVQKTFDERFEEILAYKAEHGDSNVPMSHTTLGKFVANLRARKPKLSRDKVVRLDSIGFQWNPGKGKVNNRRKDMSKNPNRKPKSEVINVNTLVPDTVKAQGAESDVSLRVLAATSLVARAGAGAERGGLDGDLERARRDDGEGPDDGTADVGMHDNLDEIRAATATAGMAGVMGAEEIERIAGMSADEAMAAVAGGDAGLRTGADDFSHIQMI
mmetsp:Transcript_38783/g.87405  ORF Transcript_38783/g.87405 Transcript_38783/m.87405 type:complete len:417 (-) Transcript_38783:22-1272(-)